MPRRVAIAIGVGQSGNLVTLNGAREGARDFADWAEALGYDVVRLIDDGQEVTANAIYNAVADTVNAGDVERLFVFFAGHGVSKGTSSDYWLLSDGPFNPNEAVNVDGSLFNAAMCGIQHVAVFADACRTMAGKDRQGVNGAAIFPSAGIENVDVELDRFFATRPGDPALEVIPDNEAEAAFGIFTKALIEALNGTDEDATVPVANGATRLAVTAQSLKKWLLQVVPQRSSAATQVAQKPDCAPVSTPPNNIITYLAITGPASLTVEVRGRGGPAATIKVYATDGNSRDFDTIFEGPPPAQVELPRGAHYEVEVIQGDREQDPDTIGIRRLVKDTRLRVRMRTPQRGVDPTPHPPPPPPMRVETVVVAEDGAEHSNAPAAGFFDVVTRDVVTGATHGGVEYLERHQKPEGRAIDIDASATDAVSELSDLRGRDHFESGNGFTVIGATVTDAFVTGARADLFKDGDQFHVRGNVDEARSLILGLDSNHWVAAALLPGFIGTAAIAYDTTGAGGVASLNYVPAPGYQWDETAPGETEQALAVATAAVRGGRFQVATSEASDVARFLRRFKHRNPTLGVFAAYAYDRVGNRAQIRDMIEYFADSGQVVPYDLELLSRRPAPNRARVAPSFPLLTQGWAYLLDEATLHPAIATARQTLAPSLWATPTGRGGEALARAIEKGDL